MDDCDVAVACSFDEDQLCTAIFSSHLTLDHPWLIPTSPPSDSLSPDKPTFSQAPLRLTPRLRHPTAQVVRGAASRRRCGVQVSKGSWLSRQLASSPVSHRAPVSVGRAISGGQPETARVHPWDCNEPLPRSGWIFLGVAEFGQHAPFIKDLFSLCPND